MSARADEETQGGRDMLPCIMCSSASYRLLKLYMREVLTTGELLRDVQASYLQALLAQSGSFRHGGAVTHRGLKTSVTRTEAVGVSLPEPISITCFSLAFAETVFSNATPTAKLQPLEQTVFGIYARGEDVLLSSSISRVIGTAVAAGGRLGRVVFVLRCGLETQTRSIVFGDWLSLDRASCFSARISEPFALPNLMSVLEHKRPVAIACGDVAGKLRFTEEELTRILYETLLAPESTTHTLVLLTPAEDLPYLILLLQLVSLNIPSVKENVAMALCCATALTMTVVVRLLIDSMSPWIRNMFIKEKTHMVSALLEKKLKGMAYFDEVKDLQEWAASKTTRLIISVHNGGLDDPHTHMTESIVKLATSNSGHRIALLTLQNPEENREAEEQGDFQVSLDHRLTSEAASTHQSTSFEDLDTELELTGYEEHLRALLGLNEEGQPEVDDANKQVDIDPLYTASKRIQRHGRSGILRDIDDFFADGCQRAFAQTPSTYTSPSALRNQSTVNGRVPGGVKKSMTPKILMGGTTVRKFVENTLAQDIQASDPFFSKSFLLKLKRHRHGDSRTPCALKDILPPQTIRPSKLDTSGIIPLTDLTRIFPYE